ncbi:MAG: STAS/SEC14 domain-containing protein [Maribacter sp.]
MDYKINKKLIRKHHLDVGSFSYYENYMISEVNEGLAFDFQKAAEMLKLTKVYYGNTTPFVYISNRKNSYSFNPTSHFKTGQMFPNLKGYAVVTYDTMNRDIAEMEKSFLASPVRIFDNLDDAIDWVAELIVLD